MNVNDKKLDEVLKILWNETTTCPPPYDFNDERWEGEDCPGINCTMCWKLYLKENPA